MFGIIMLNPSKLDEFLEQEASCWSYICIYFKSFWIIIFVSQSRFAIVNVVLGQWHAGTEELMVDSFRCCVSYAAPLALANDATCMWARRAAVQLGAHTSPKPKVSTFHKLISKTKSIQNNFGTNL